MIARRDVDPPLPPVGVPADDPAVEDVARAREGGGWVVCAACGRFVAESRARMAVDGAHRHSFINPAGMIFRVACFAEAPGVVPVGDESAFFTWFAGFAWRVALCRGCGEHLGWSYRSDDSGFVALIEERIVERSAPEGMN
ncbi:MAG TPA: cereblon family protein [Polyangiaceae bacterium]|nr:cereblon family protein [Polyangiaceae bacterium]